MRKTITLLIALLALTVSSWAQIGPIDGLYYEIDELGNATLIQDPAQAGSWQSYGTSISGALFIKGTVNYNSTDYPVTSIGEKAFVQNHSIPYISIEEGVTSIGMYAFTSCYALCVVLPSTIAELGYNAFASSHLTTVVIKAETPPSLSSSFDDVNSLAHIYVPAESVEDYKAADGWITYADIIEAIPSTPVSTEWDATELSTINISGGPLSDAPSTTIDNVTVVANAPVPSYSGGDDYCHLKYDYGYTGFSMRNNGSLLFTSFLGNLTSIVIPCDLWPSDMILPSGWFWDNENSQLKWTGNASSVVLMGDGSSTSFTSGPISSIVFTFAQETPDPTPDPTPEGPSFIWEARQVNLVSLNCYNGYKNAKMGLIKNIFASLTQTRDKNDDYEDPGYESCEFTNGQVHISNSCGELAFKSIVGDLTGIVISCSYVNNATDLSANWHYDSEAKTLTWVGTPAEEVTISGDLNFYINTIEFFYSPAAAPRVDEEFYDGWQWYKITGAHTAKVTGPRNLGGSINIPAEIEDGGVTYYINEIDDYAFYNYSQMSNAFIGENIARIGAHALDGCTWMAEITVNSHVLETIGEAAFRNCLLLQDIQIFTELPPVLGSNAFEGDSRLKHIHVYTTYAYKATSGWSAHEDVIGALYSNPALGEEFFYHNQMTTGIYEVTSVSPTKEAKVLPYSDEVNAIYPITYESTLVIPESPDYIHYGYSVTAIGANAFKDITDFNVVLIPQTVKSIEAGAFSGCTNVENVFFLWDNPTTVTWADANVGAEFATATSGTTKIIVPAGKLEEYKAWAPAWASCMIGGEIEDVTATEDPLSHAVYYRTFYDSQHDYMLPPDVWAYAGYVDGAEFVLRPVAFDGGILPAATPVVLRSFSPEYRLIAMAPSVPAYTGPNDLRGTDVDILVSSLGGDAAKVYVLGKEAWVNSERTEGMGMYRYTGTTLYAHKAYLIYNTSEPLLHAPVRFLFHQEEQATGFENLNQSNSVDKLIENGQLIIIKNGVRYNAQGQIVK